MHVIPTNCGLCTPRGRPRALLASGGLLPERLQTWVAFGSRKPADNVSRA